MAPEKVTDMILNVDLKCSGCYKKVKKVVSKMPQIRDQVFDVDKNEVRIKVVCCSPENIRDKLCYKGGGAIQSIEIVEKPKEPADKPKVVADKPKEVKPPADKPKEAKPAGDKPKEPEKAKPAAEKPKEPEKPKPAADKPNVEEPNFQSKPNNTVDKTTSQRWLTALDNGEGEETEECDVEAWETLSKGFKEAQTVLDQNRLLIQQVNENHQSKIPDNMVKNVKLIQEINGNISKVNSVYSNLSMDFSKLVNQRRVKSKNDKVDIADS